MSKKIKKQELEKIIAEEISNLLIHEGFFNQVGAGIKKAVKGIPSAYRTGVEDQKQKDLQTKDRQENLQAIADFLQFMRGDSAIQNLVMTTSLGKKIFGLKEVYESPVMKLLNQKATTEDITNFFSVMQADKRARNILNKFLKQKLSEPQPPQEQPATSEESGETAPDTSGAPVAYQGPQEPSLSSKVPQPDPKQMADAIMGEIGDILQQPQKEPVTTGIMRAVEKEAIKGIQENKTKKK